MIGKLAPLRLNQGWNLMKLCLLLAHIRDLHLLSFLMQEEARSKRRTTESKTKPIERITGTKSEPLPCLFAETTQSELL